MNFDSEKIAEDFFELASEQRVRILLSINKKKLTQSKLAKELDASASEVHRNVTRLLKSGWIEKDPESHFFPTVPGKVILEILPAFDFLSKNQNFLKKHDFGNLEKKFLHRIGELGDNTRIKGFVKVIEKWKEIHNNADEYIYNLLPEVPYSKDIIDVVEKKLKAGIPIRSIFAESTIIPEERKETYQRKNFAKFIKNGILDRRMVKQISIVVLLNEKESCAIFPTKNDGIDMGEMFYSKDPDFHNWCLDYFNDCWESSGFFNEAKLN